MRTSRRGAICLCLLYLDPELRRGFFFFLNDTAPTEISPLSLHDALPISVLALVATLAVPRDGQTQMGGTPAQGAQSQSQGAGAAPPFDLKDEAVVKQGATLFATTCSY